MFCFKNYLEIVQLHKAVVLISLTKSDESCRLSSAEKCFCVQFPGKLSPLNTLLTCLIKHYNQFSHDL